MGELAGQVEKEFRESPSLREALNITLSNHLVTSMAGAHTCQWNAALEICSFSKRSTNNCILIAEAGAIPVLVNLCIYENNKELIMFAGAVTSIVQFLRAGTMESRENSAAALLHFSQ
ncbi:hypothetical protein DY000_02031545 [Brassica cretica]|uniref:Uncharacterized protein n=1 Tax=Brassica cretica TaxID=69181 RepID=A0ABQ7DJV6_BRACR|nr:hypothetical protein DY000_02031545 [Brassica cretica]